MVTKNTKKILNFILRNFEMRNINQISRELKISVGSSFKILKNLEKDNFVVSHKMGNALYYKINFNNPELIKNMELILIEGERNLTGYPKIYSKDLFEFRCPLIVLFGSILNSKNFNDVDVLFVGCNEKKVLDFCLELSKFRSKPVVPLILSKRGLIKELKNKKNSLLEIFKKGVVLKGERVFMEVIKDVKR